MNKTAKEMFEELGYERYEDSKCILFSAHLLNLIKTRYFTKNLDFCKSDKSIHIYYFSEVSNDAIQKLSMEELEAINQQCKELGWLDYCMNKKEVL